MTTLVKSFPTHAVRALLVLTVVGLAACTGSSVAETPPASVALAVPPQVVTLPSAAPTAIPTDEALSPSPDASEPASAEPSAVPTAIDPCQLITAEEAGTLAHATFGPGKEETLKGNSKMCTYGAKTKNVFEVIVAIAPDVATAKKQEASAEADLKANAADLEQGMTITKLPGIRPGHGRGPPGAQAQYHRRLRTGDLRPPGDLVLRLQRPRPRWVGSLGGRDEVRGDDGPRQAAVDVPGGNMALPALRRQCSLLRWDPAGALHGRDALLVAAPVPGADRVGL